MRPSVLLASHPIWREMGLKDEWGEVAPDQCQRLLADSGAYVGPYSMSNHKYVGTACRENPSGPGA